MNQSSREVLFFIFAAVLFFALIVIVHTQYNKDKGLPYGMTAILAIVYTLILVFVFYIGKIEGREGFADKFWDISPAAQCKGGPYMHQGDDPQSKMCRRLMASEKGRCAIAAFNCPVGYNGAPMNKFVYTPLSNDSYENERCQPDKEEGCDVVEEETMQSTMKKTNYEGDWGKCTEE